MKEQDRTPGARPQALDVCARGRLANDPREIQRGERTPIVTARMAIPMAGSDTPAELRDQATEWVDVVAFAAAQRSRLLAARKGSLIVVAGGMTKRLFKHKDGRPGEGRRIAAEYILCPEASAAGPAAAPEAAEIPEELKNIVAGEIEAENPGVLPD